MLPNSLLHVENCEAGYCAALGHLHEQYYGLPAVRQMVMAT